MNITIQFGAGNSLSREFPAGYTVGQLRRDNTVRAALGYGENVNFVVDGVAQADDSALSHDDTVVVETAVGRKATA